MKILVTGASGFIGSHLTERLAKEGYDIRAMIRKKENKQKTDSLKLLKELNVEMVEGDLLDIDSLKKAVKGVDIVFHLAAIARPMAIPNKLYFKINEEGTRNLLEVCRGNKIKKIIMMSSVSAVGPTRDGNPVNEETKCHPVDVYGWSKLAQEKVAEEYFQKYNLPIVLLRPPMVSGARDFELLKLFKAVNMRFFPIRSKVKGMEFLYVENLVEACFLAMKKGKNGQKYHISNGEHYSINEIISSIEKAEKKRIIPIYFPKSLFAVFGYCIEFIAKVLHFHPPFKHDTVVWMTDKFWYSDISKAKKELQYKPIISLDEGTRRTAEYYKEKGIIR